MVELTKTPSFRLDGKRALVTGAGRGLGWPPHPRWPTPARMSRSPPAPRMKSKKRPMRSARAGKKPTRSRSM